MTATTTSPLIPYTPAWYRTMEKINPLLTGLIRHRTFTQRKTMRADHCAICGTDGAESHELLMQGHLISLSSCARCYVLHGASFRPNMLAAAMIQPAGKTQVKESA